MLFIYFFLEMDFWNTYTLYIRSKINSYKAKLLDLDSVFESAGHAEKPISLRKAAATNSISEAHEYCPISL